MQLKSINGSSVATMVNADTMKICLVDEKTLQESLVDLIFLYKNFQCRKKM